METIEQVVVGQNHFIVRFNTNKIYAWGCYNTDSEDKLLFRPKEMTFFGTAKHKVISMTSSDGNTAALVETESKL